MAMRLQEKSIDQVTTGTNVNCPCNKYYEGEKEMIMLLRLHDRVILTLLKRLECPFIPSKGTGRGQRTTWGIRDRKILCRERCIGKANARRAQISEWKLKGEAICVISRSFIILRTNMRP